MNNSTVREMSFVTVEDLEEREFRFEIDRCEVFARALVDARRIFRSCVKDHRSREGTIEFPLELGALTVVTQVELVVTGPAVGLSSGEGRNEEERVFLPQPVVTKLIALLVVVGDHFLQLRDHMSILFGHVAEFHQLVEISDGVHVGELFLTRFLLFTLTERAMEEGLEEGKGG